MIGIFQGRGIADRARAHAQVDVDFRSHVHLFNNGRNLNALGVFLCIALHANENGWAWPSRDLLKKETGISTEAALTSALKHLRSIRVQGQRVFAHYRENRKDGKHGHSAYLIFPDLPSGGPPNIFENLQEYSPGETNSEDERQPLMVNPLTVNPPTDEPLADHPSHEAEPCEQEPCEQEPSEDCAGAQNSDSQSEQAETLHSEPVQEGESESDALAGQLEEFFGPRKEREPLTAEPRSWFAVPPEERGRNTAVPVQAGGAHTPAETVIEGICRYNYGYGMDALPETQRKNMVVKVAGILEEWGGATVGQAKLAWDAWTVRCAFKGRTANPFYSSFPNEFGPLLVGVRDGTITAAMLRAEADGNGRGKASAPTPEAVRVYR